MRSLLFAEEPEHAFRFTSTQAVSLVLHMKTSFPIIERLESRITPAGNVIAQLIGTHLILIGDAEANTLVVSQDQDERFEFTISSSDQTTTINGSSDPATFRNVTGDLRLFLGGGDDYILFGNNAIDPIKVSSNLRINGGAGDNIVDLRGSVTVGGSLFVENGRGDDRFISNGALHVAGNVTIRHGFGDSDTSLNPYVDRIVIGGSVRVSSGPGGVFSFNMYTTTVEGGVSINGHAASRVDWMIGATGFDDLVALHTVEVGRALRLAGTSSGDQIRIFNTDVHAGTVISAGAGNDRISFSDVSFQGALHVDAGAGDDHVAVERDGYAFRPSTFTGPVVIELSRGNDVLRIGVAGDATVGANFLEEVRFNGGFGVDRIDGANAEFLIAPEFPSFERFGAPPVFGEPIAISSANEISEIISGHFNRDGRADLASIENDGQVAIRLGTGDGRFGAPILRPTGSEMTDLAVAYFDSSADADIVLTDLSPTGSGGIILLLGNGDGTFEEREFPAGTGANPVALALGDLNSDGNPDVVTGNRAGENGASVSVLFGTGEGSFLPALVHPLLSGSPTLGATDVAVGDLNGDGKHDVVVSTPNVLAIFLNTGAGSLQLSSIKDRDSLTSLLLYQVNGDGALDLVSWGNSLVVQYGDGNGAFGPEITFDFFPVSDVVISDFNFDHVIDLVVTRPGANPSLAFYAGFGNGNFRPAIGLPLSFQPGSLTTGNFNNDFHDDLAVINESDSGIAIFPNQTS